MSKESPVSTTSIQRPVFPRPGCGGMLAVAILVCAGAVITLLNTLVYNPEAAVEEYVDALRSGDGAAAMALSKGYLAEDAPDTVSTVMLDGETLAASAAVLESAEIVTVDAEVPESFRAADLTQRVVDRKSTRLNSSHVAISYAVFCLKKKKQES